MACGEAVECLEHAQREERVDRMVERAHGPLEELLLLPLIQHQQVDRLVQLRRELLAAATAAVVVVVVVVVAAAVVVVVVVVVASSSRRRLQQW